MSISYQQVLATTGLMLKEVEIDLFRVSDDKLVFEVIGQDAADRLVKEGYTVTCIGTSVILA